MFLQWFKSVNPINEWNFVSSYKNNTKQHYPSMSLAHKGYYRKSAFDEAAHLQIRGHNISLTDVYLFMCFLINN